MFNNLGRRPEAPPTLILEPGTWNVELGTYV